MKKIAIFTIFVTAFFACANAETPVQRRGQSVSQPSESTAQTSVSVRSAVRPTSARSAAMPSATSSNVRTISARSAATPMSAPVVSARAGTMQKVINSGTAISGANKNLVVNDLCKQKYDGCMDSFCMIENTSGGRCICSNRKAELDQIQSEIQNLDAQSYKMATEGVEKIEMGSDADKAIAAANETAQSISENTKQEAQSKKRTLDLSQWNQTESDSIDQNIFAEKQINSVEGKVGDDLYNSVAQLCSAQIPECSDDVSMIQMIYAQNIKADCTAYENDLKKQKNASAQKLATAQKALRDAALDSLHAANKYDLGQCTIAFKKCMTDTAGCKSDFTGCVGIAAAENAKMSNNSKSSMKTVDITGSNTKISIAASTMDALESKKPMCENITNSCVAVKDQVWNTFLRDVAPTLKTAELAAESDLRTNCISNISSCFQKACKDTMDPNNPDGSYDMCLSRPETVRSLCKVQIDPCVSAEPLILDYVYAKLSAMRVDSCTTEVKECLQSDDRCGSDYTKCVGLDTDTIIRMCPYDKLVGCQKVYSSDKTGKSITDDAVYDELATMVQGIILNIDNNMLTQCQKAADAAMVKVCGSTDDCNGLVISDGTGSHSLQYQMCKYENNSVTNYCRTDVSGFSDDELAGVLGSDNKTRINASVIKGNIYGQIYWDNLTYDSKGSIISLSDYVVNINNNNSLSSDKKYELTNDSTINSVGSELSSLKRSVDTAIDAIESDQTVQYCMTGRQFQGMSGQLLGRSTSDDSNVGKRFPNLTKQMRITITTTAIKMAMENYYKKYDELNESMSKDYVKMQERIASVKGEDAENVKREYARVGCLRLADPSVSEDYFNTDKKPMSASKKLKSWIFEEEITAAFDWDKMTCHLCRNLPISKKGETCTDTQF